MKYENYKLRRAIAKSGITQKKLAEKVGISHITLCNWLGKELTDEQAKRISTALEELKVGK